MPTGDSALVDFLRATLRCEGPITFARFMEQALYHPQHGYYSSGRCVPGRGGDYFTSVSVGPLFGRLLAAQFAEMWEALGRITDFAIVEQGAHNGDFAHDVLTAAQSDHPDFFAALRYDIVEPFPVLRERQTTTLEKLADNVTWHSSLEAMPPFRGVHFSNELLDALPVHLMRWTGKEWTERHVTLRDGDFDFANAPLSQSALAKRLDSIPMPLPAGYETEVNLAALDWIETLASKITSGFVLAADYGWPRADYYAPQRTTGTLRCYAQHRIVPSPFEEIGHTDLTAHVEWTSLVEHAQTCGLTVVGFTDQHHFLTGLLTGDFGGRVVASADVKSKRALQTLLHPQHLGMKFQFLALSKTVNPAALSGLRFARDPAAAPGLKAS